MIAFATGIGGRRAMRWAAVVGGILGVMALGCGKKSATAPNPATTGTLIVSVTPLGSAATSVTVGGPSSYAITFGATDTLIGLAAGSYFVANAHATATDPVVTPFYDSTVTGSPVSVSIRDTLHISVTFARRSGTGGLWVGSSNGGSPVAAEYTSGALSTAGAASAIVSVVGGYEAFDVVGNLWIADSGANRILEYAAAQLGATGTPSAAVTVTSSALSGPVGLAFDRTGDLWVANYNGNMITEFTASQLVAGGSLTPAVVLTGSALNGPSRMSFDAYGNLWVPNAGANTVVGFAPSALAVSGSPTPGITLSASSGSLDAPRGVAFDEQGNLWVANATGNTIVAYSNGQLTAGGSATPIETLVIPTANGTPAAIAFDNSGDLWATSAASSAIIEYTAPQIVAGGSAAPALVFAVASSPVSLAFNPSPDGLPIIGIRSAKVERGR